MSKALVLGCGNIQRGDDGVALHVLNHLREALWNPAEFVFQQQLTPELAEPISQAETVIFVDADQGTPPGSIACRALRPEAGKSCAHTHLTSVESLLLVAERLYGAYPDRAYLVTIAGASFELEEALSDPVRRAIPCAAERVQELLSGITRDKL